MSKIYKYIIDFVSNSTSFERSLSTIKKDSTSAEAGIGKLAGTIKGDMTAAGQSMSAFASGDISALPGIFQAGSSSAGIFTKSLTGIKAALISTGIGALVVALGTAIAAVTHYFKGTEEGQIAFAKVMNKVKSYTEPVLQLFGRLGKSLVQLFQGDFSGAWSTVKEAFSQVDDAIENNIKNLGELNKLEEDLIKRRRAAGSEEKRLQAEISDLRNKANDEENYSSEQRQRFIADALAKTKELGNLRLGLAQDELRLEELKADQGDNDIATNDKLVQLKDAALEISRQTSDESRRMLETQQRINREIQTEAKKREEAFEKLKKAQDELTDGIDFSLNVDSNNLFKGVDKEIAQAFKDIGSSIPDDKLKEMAETMKQWTKSDSISFLQSQFASLGQSISGTAGSFFGFASQMLQMIPQLIAQILALTTAQNASSLAIISAKYGEAMASGVAASQKVPFPLNLVALAATLAAVVGAFTSIPKFATGGIVGGSSFSGDNVLVRVNSGEEILRRNDPRHRLNQSGVASGGGGSQVKVLIPRTVIRKGDIYISYEEGKKEYQKRNGRG